MFGEENAFSHFIVVEFFEGYICLNDDKYKGKFSTFGILNYLPKNKWKNVNLRFNYYS